MKIKYSTKPKISISLLYLLTLLITSTLSAGEQNLGSQFLDLYFRYFDKMNPYHFQSVFRNSFDFVPTTAIFQNLQNIIHSKNTVINNLQNYETKLMEENSGEKGNPQKNIKLMATLDMINSVKQGTSDSLYDIERLNKDIFVPTRYNNIDSYIWNSMKFDFFSTFENPKQGEGNTQFFYPSSQITVPEWTLEGVKMDLWMTPYEVESRISDNFEFIAISAPFHQLLILNDSKKLPKVKNLNNLFLNPSMPKPMPNINDLNMIYFFKMIYNENIKIVIAICSDPTGQEEDENDFTFNFNESMGVMNKCHLYWRISFKITMFKDEYLVVPTLDSSKTTNLYKVYNLKIYKESQVIHAFDVYVLSEWPDHQKLPQDMVGAQLELYNHLYTYINNGKDGWKNRVLIHCSAGVGRTGTTIMGYQMYKQMRESPMVNVMRGTATFNDLVLNYETNENNLSYPVMSTVKKDILKNMDTSKKLVPSDPLTLKEDVEILHSSKFAHYLIDSIMYYRMRRMLFVQTVDQFDFLIKFGGMLSFDMIRDHLSPTAKEVLNIEQFGHDSNFLDPMRMEKKKFMEKSENKPPSPIKESPKKADTSNEKQKINKVESVVKSDKKESSPLKESGSMKGKEKPVEKPEDQPKEIGGIIMSEKYRKKMEANLAKQNSKGPNMLI